MERFRPKSEEDLQEQIAETSEILEVPVIPESKRGNVLSMTIEEIKEKYPERYNVYVRLLRAKKNGVEISIEEQREMGVWIRALNNLEDYILKHSHVKEGSDARTKRQLDVFEDIRDHLEKGEIEGYIKLPTGVGKTVLFSRITESLGLKTLLVVPSIILIGQTGEKLEKFTDVEYGVYYKDEKNLEENVTIITYLSLVRAVKEGKINSDDYDLLILDEAHKALGEETVDIINRFQSIKLGFSATPRYSRSKHVRNLLEHEMHSMTIIEAAQERLISRFKNYIAYTDIDISSVEVVGRERYDQDQLERAIDKEGRNKSAVELYKHQFEGKQAIAYCSGINHATHVAATFKQEGIPAEVISGHTSDGEKLKILERFKTGQTNVLCNAKILIEGFDEPHASVCLNLHPTLSHVDAEQRAGRVLRLDPDDSEKWGYIIDFIDRNSRVPTLTFAEIAQASYVDENNVVSLPRPGSDGGEEGEDGYVPIPDINIQGLRVVVDAREVLQVAHNSLDGRITEREDFIKFDGLITEVREIGISTKDGYYQYLKDHPELNWPVHPERESYSKGEWKSWADFFGKEDMIDDLEKLRTAVKEAGIKSSMEYNAYRAIHPEVPWPSAPHNACKGWISWPDLLGKEIKKFIDYEIFKKEIQETGIKMRKDYLALRRTLGKTATWPSNPDKNYKDAGWTSWNDLIGAETVEFLTLDDLKKEVIANKIKTRSEYLYFKKTHEKNSWPSNPDKYLGYSNWKSWSDFFEG